jgi:predicted transposase YdaD
MSHQTDGESFPLLQDGPIDHDRLFKELLRTFFVEFIELFFPELAAYMDPESVTFLDREIFTDVTEGETYEPDIVVRVRFRAPYDTEAFFLIHAEAQSYPQREFNRRMFLYFARLYELHGLPVYPIAVFSFDKPERPEPDTFEVRFPDLDVLTFRYRVVQLNRLHWRDFLNAHNPVACALMAKMNIAPSDREYVKWECLRLMITRRLDRARMRLIAGFVDRYLRLSHKAEIELRDYLKATYKTGQEAQAVELLTTFERVALEEGREEGILQGRMEGIEAGRTEGMEIVIVGILSKKFGELPERLEARIRELSENPCKNSR